MSTISVFIVEDDPMVLDVNKNFLAKLTGFTLVGEASNGEQAFEDIKRLRPNLILLDMFLPDLTGMELFTKLRQERIPSDVIMITAARDMATVQEAIRFGAVDYLIKPFRAERFQKALQNYRIQTKSLAATGLLRQEDLDQFFGHTSEQVELPKGLNEITMQQIKEELQTIKGAITSEQLAQNVGMARVTVRKYLDYLAGRGKVHIDLKYGTVGRPTKYYSLK